MLIRTLERSDRRDGFTCGEPALDIFLQRYAWQNQKRYHLGVTYVAVDERSHRVVGYFTAAAGSISRDSVAGPLRVAGGYDSIPIMRIARLAVDRRMQGVGIGSELVRAALLLAMSESTRVGCAGVVVDALPTSVAFYERFGFQAIGVRVGTSTGRPKPVPMMITMGVIRRAAE